MKLIYILIALISFNTHSMSTKYKLLNPPTRSQEVAANLKELGYSLKQQPLLSGLCASLLVAGTAFTWNIHPLACVGLHYFTTLPTTIVLAEVLRYEVARRKSNHRTLAFFSIEKKEFDKVTQFASKTCYEETDPAALKEQNTEFLFEALDKYNECGYYTSQKYEAAKYAQAAEIFIKHHADVKKVKEILSNYYMPKASEWFEQNASEQKSN
jgi:hypothetical protein